MIYDSFQFYCHPLGKTSKKKMAGHAKIRRILNNLPVFPKENCTSKKTYREFLRFAGTVFFWEHREII